MAKTNRPAAPRPQTHEGGRAMAQSPELELRRAVASCLLWEDTYYESGAAIAARIADLCERVDPAAVAAIAVSARADLYLRHVPLWLARQLARLSRGRLVGDTLAQVVRRADELTEFLALYWGDGKTPNAPAKLSAQVKRGLALAFRKFDAYQLAKYDRGGEGVVRLRDVLRLAHPKPADEAQSALWKSLLAGELEPPDTWEVALSGGADKKATWERLLRDRKLGYVALLRNLRNMEGAGVPTPIVEEALTNPERVRTARVLPFQFVSAYRAAPKFADALDRAMAAMLAGRPTLAGRTALVVDVSGSMDSPMATGGLRARLRHGYVPSFVPTRIDTAGALAILLRELCEECRVWTFSNTTVEVANLRGFGLLEGIHRSQGHGGTWLGQALDAIQPTTAAWDRVVVVTDEQAHDDVRKAWTTSAYVVNVAPYAPALDTRQGWMRVNGFSDRIVDWIRVEEAGGDYAAAKDGTDTAIPVVAAE